MKLNEILKRRQEISIELGRLSKEYEKMTGIFKKENEELARLESIAVNDVTLDYVMIAEKILYTRGNPSNTCEREVLTELAAYDIAHGGKHLAKEFYGNKNYGSYYQRCDCQYGYGPRHGSICEEVGLRSEYRGEELTDEEKDACIYYLKNFKKIYDATKKAVV